MRVPRGPSNVPQSLRSGVQAIEITFKPAEMIACWTYYMQSGFCRAVDDNLFLFCKVQKLACIVTDSGHVTWCPGSK